MWTRARLWWLFVGAHAVVITLAYLSPRPTKYDVTSVYQPWATAALGPAHDVVGVTEPWVYPVLALVPILLTALLSVLGGYTVAWAVLVVALDALAFAVLVGSARSAGRRSAAVFWMAALAALGPVALYRLEAVTVPLAVLGSLWLLGRPWLGSVLLAVATWVKVWPAALLGAAVVAGRRRGAVLGGAVGVTVVVVGVLAVLGGLDQLFGFVTVQSDRGVQVEAPVGTPYVWLAAFGVGGAEVFFNKPLITYEVTGPAVDVVAGAMTPLLAVTGLLVVGLGALQAWRGASFVRLYPVLSLATVLLLVVVNKVGSPQYYAWLIPPVVLALAVDRRRWLAPAVVVVVTCGLTQAVFPWLYTDLLDATVPAAVVVTVRNLLVVGLLGWTVARLVRVPPGRRHR